MKTLWKIVVSLGIIGAVLMVVGLVLGANSSGFYFNENGLNMYNKGSERIVVMDLEAIQDIEIDVASANIRFISADSYGIEIISKRDGAFKYYIDDGRLVVKETRDLSFFIFNFNWEAEYVNVYLPANADLASIVIKNDSGNIELAELNCETLRIDLVSGNMKVSDIKASTISLYDESGKINAKKLEAEKFNFHVTSGTLVAQDIVSQDLVARVLSGNAKIDGLLKGHSDISVTSGGVELEIIGSEQDYNRDISVVSGSVKINGNKNSAGTVDFKAANSLRIKVTSGNVKLNFTK